MEGDTTRVHAYDYLVVIDFEATCDEGNSGFSRENQEVIEFPWVVVDLHNGVVIDQKQLYVKPEWTKELSSFCTEKTGITNDKLHDAPYLVDALAQFDLYVRETFLVKGKTFCILTDGDWDLKVCLLQEARKKNIKLAPYMFAYFDLKEEFQKDFPQARKPSLKQMVDKVGLNFMGRAHSGLDDSGNVANVVLKMLEYGHVFTVPNLVPEDYDPANDPSFVDYNASGGGGAGGKGPSIFSRLPDGSEEETTVVVIRGLPWSAAEGEIEEFFGGGEGGVVEGGVHIINNKNGRPSGVAYVEFENPEFTRQALSKNNTYMGSRYIEVYLSDAQRMGVVLEGQAKIAERIGTGNGVHPVGVGGGAGGGGSGGGGINEDIRPGDWRCPSCNDHQFASRTACRKCGTAKPGVELSMGGGHPSHPHPHHHHHHGGFPPAGAPFGQPMHHQQFHPHQPFIPMHVGAAGGGGPMHGNGTLNVRPGDWHCPVCSDLNFASRKVCRKCNAPSPLTVKGGISGGSDKFGSAEQWGWGAQPISKDSRAMDVRPGDWNCPGCNDLNFASRRVCRKCGAANPSFSVKPAGRGGKKGGYRGGEGGGWPHYEKDRFRPGDWYCPACSHLNFASREVCRQCGTAADQVEGEGSPQDQGFGWQ